MENYFATKITPKSVAERELPFFETSDALSAFALIEMASVDKDMSLLVGEAGVGKTRAIKEFAKKHPTAILVEATPSINAKRLFELICDNLNLVSRKNIDATIRMVASHLKKYEKIVIIDEAENLPYKALEHLRRCYDLSENFPLILVGTMRLYDNLTGAGNKKREFLQLSSRVGGKFQLKGLQKQGDIDAVCDYFGIKDRKIATNCLKLTRGNFRKTEKLLKRAKLIASKNASAINDQILEMAASTILL